MSSSSEITYCLIFDTNALFQAYEKKADFTTFSFNATFEHVVGMIEQLDIYEYVTIAIPYRLSIQKKKMKIRYEF